MNTSETTAAVERLIAFVNTLNIETGHDDMATSEEVAGWFTAQGLVEPGTTATFRDVGDAHALREALRRAFLAHHGHTDDAGGAEASVPLRLVVSSDGEVSLAPAMDGIAAGLARLVSSIPAAAADGSWERAKACPKDTCQWAFFDQSRNRSRRWCSMEVCGNQEKTRTFRQRQRADD